MDGPVPFGVLASELEGSAGGPEGNGRAVVGVGPGSLNCGSISGGK